MSRVPMVRRDHPTQNHSTQVNMTNCTIDNCGSGLVVGAGAIVNIDGLMVTNTPVALETRNGGIIRGRNITHIP